MKEYYWRSMTLTANVADRAAEDESAVFDANAYGASGSHSQPMHVSFPNYINPLSRFAAAAFSAIGLKQILGFASGVLRGFG